MISETGVKESSPKQRTTRQRLLRSIGLYVFVPYLSVTLIFAVFQRKLIYRPLTSGRLTVNNTVFQDGQDVELEADNGATIRGWLLVSTSRQPSTDSQPRTLVLYFPGNSLNRSHRETDMQEFLRAGVDVLVFDYQGFGDSEGSPSEFQLTRDAARIWDFARSLPQYSERQIVIYGESLGGAVAVSLWSGKSNPKPAAVILNSTFTRMSDVVSSHYPLFPFHLLLIDPWNSIEHIGKIDCPVYAFHGTDDSIVPFALGRELSRTGQSVEFCEIRGGEHNDVPTLRLQNLLRRLVRQLNFSL